MIIKKYLAKTEVEAIEMAKEDLGNNAIVMNIKKVRPRGLAKIFVKAKVEVTAALDENKNYSEPVQKSEPAKKSDKPGQNFDAVTPEEPVIPPMPGQELKEQSIQDKLSKLESLLEQQIKNEKTEEKIEDSRSKEKAA